MPFPYIKARLEEVKLRISRAAEKAGRKGEEVKLVAVSKTFPAEAVLAAYEAGHRLFGENRVQELLAKAPALPSDIEWHLIGHLQSNKAADAVEAAKCIHSADSEKLLLRIDRIAEETNRKPEILIEVNISGEDSKFGLRNENEIMSCAETAFKCANISFAGFMTMAPYGAPESELRRIFSGLRELRGKIQEKLSAKLPDLSMGMSGDFEIAIEEGATIVRIGTAIFGDKESP